VVDAVCSTALRLLQQAGVEEYACMVVCAVKDAGRPAAACRVVGTVLIVATRDVVIDAESDRRLRVPDM
jgi:hypothetical protein